MLAFVKSIKSSMFPICRPLLKLKLSFFLVYSIWFSVFPYVVLISTQLISLNQLAIVHACVPLSSIFGPIISGFIADKIGNYKIVLIFNLLLGATVYLPVVWLKAEHEMYQSTLRKQNHYNISSSSNESESNNLQVEPIQFYLEPYMFPILLVIRLLGFFAFDCANSILDACGLTMTKKHGGDFSRQKLFSTFSMILMPLICGPLIDVVSEYRGFRDNSLAFYISSFMALSAIPVVYMMDVDVKKNKQSLIKTAKAIMRMVDVDIFLLVQIVVGICWAWHRSFLAVYLDWELQASKTLMGVAFSMGGIGTLVMYWVATFIVDRLGAPNTVGLTLLVSASRFITYYFTANQWVLLVGESLDGVSGFLAIVAGSYFCQAASPPGMLASLNGILAAAIYGAGRALGLTIGSLLVAAYGLRFAYLAIGILAAGTSVFYLIAYHSVLRKMEQKRLSENSIKEVVGIENKTIDLKDEEANIATETIRNP